MQGLKAEPGEGHGSLGSGAGIGRWATPSAEAVVGHPARRRIIMALMLLGNVGLTTALAGILGGFLQTDAFLDELLKVLLLVGGLGLVYAASLSSRVDRILSHTMGRLLSRFTDLDVRDYASLLHISGDYQVKEMLAREGSWLLGRELHDLHLRDEGIIFLGIVRKDGSYLGIPSRESCIRAGDTMILYGRNSAFVRLGSRDATDAGERGHHEAVAEQRQVARQERAATTETG